MKGPGRVVTPWGRLALALGVLVAALAGTGAADASPRRPPRVVAYDGPPSVGALFPSATATGHYCTAGVVDSPAGDLIVTAAHCVGGTGRRAAFVPGYDDGARPYGTWTVTAAYAPSGWEHGHDDRYDVVFLRVAPRVIGGRVRSLQSVTGGHRLGRAPARGARVSVPAYAGGSDDRPFTCSATVYYHRGFPAFDCWSYPDGTSGAGWLRATPSGTVVVGVIGGLHQGGCTVLTSYTSVFGAQVRAAYLRASADRDPDTLPAAGRDGC